MRSVRGRYASIRAMRSRATRREALKRFGSAAGAAWLWAHRAPPTRGRSRRPASRSRSPSPHWSGTSITVTGRRPPSVLEDDGALGPRGGGPGANAPAARRSGPVKAGDLAVRFTAVPRHSPSNCSGTSRPAHRPRRRDAGRCAFRSARVRCSASAKAVRNSIARARPTPTAMGKADISCGPTAAAYPFNGWSAPTAGACSSIIRWAHSISRARTAC